MDSPDYIVEINGLSPAKPDAPVQSSGESSGGQTGRPWLAILWRCCHVYSRVYRNAQGTAYEGRCPKCAKLVKLRIGPDGTASRFFEAS